MVVKTYICERCNIDFEFDEENYDEEKPIADLPVRLTDERYNEDYWFCSHRCLDLSEARFK